MAKIWIEEVYNKLSESLIGSVRALTFRYRLQNNKIFGKTEEDPILSHLQVSANFEGNSLQQVFLNKLGQINFPEEEEIAEIFKKFCWSVQDISINELDVFFIDNTQVEGNTPYHYLIEQLENDSKEFYQEYGKILANFPGLLFHFFKSDEELFMETGLKTLVLKIKGSQEQMLSEYLRAILEKVSEIDCNVEDLMCEEFDSKSNRKVNMKVVDDIEGSLFGEQGSEYLCEVKQRSQCEKFLTILTEKSAEFFEGLEYLKHERNEINKIVQEDMSYVEVLRERGVYLNVESVLKSLLDLHKSVTVSDVKKANDFVRNQMNVSNFQVSLSQAVM